MRRAPLLALLTAHKPFDDTERQMLQRMLRFVESRPDCFERSLQEGHVTGSAWVLNAAGTHVLLLHHRKLDRWLQPGGHCDGDPDVLRVALREAQEESGLIKLMPDSPALFDVDVHWIPQRGEIPGHWHYDARFLLKAAPDEELRPNNESKGARWMPLDEAAKLAEASLQRMALKSMRFQV
jgi:8-oxo-dGTP pyrophosphatase MutT (NUDIX family)